jgi:ActR/RegA family two-component response regulator
MSQLDALVVVDRTVVSNHGADPRLVSIPPDSKVIKHQIIQALMEIAGPDFLLPSPKRVQWEYLVAVLGLCNGNISEVARRVGMQRRSVQRILTTKRPPSR